MPPNTLTSLGTSNPAVIFQITLAANTFVRFDACASSFDTLLNLQDVTGDFESGTTAATIFGWNDDGCPFSTNTYGSLIHTEVSAGTYYLWLTSAASEVTTGTDSNQGAFTLSMTCFTPPPTPVGTITCGTAVTGSMPTTTAQYYIPTGFNTNGQVIYSFTPSSNSITIDSTGSLFTPVYVLTLANWQDQLDSDTAFPWAVSSGTTYYLVVSEPPATDSSTAPTYSITVTCS